MQGTRRDVAASADPFAVLEPGQFGRWLADGRWYVRPPLNAAGVAYAARLVTHAVVEHPGGTITVSPSILQVGGDGETVWHGWLEAGVWRSC